MRLISAICISVSGLTFCVSDEAHRYIKYSFFRNLEFEVFFQWGYGKYVLHRKLPRFPKMCTLD